MSQVTHAPETSDTLGADTAADDARAAPVRPRGAPGAAHDPRGGRLAHDSEGVSVRDLHAWYARGPAVKGVSLDMRPNHVTALIGPSGCGKSTLLRCLNRMHEEIPGAGMRGGVELDGCDLYGPGVDPVAVRATVGMVFQRPNPFPTRSVFENVAAGLRLGGSRRVRRSEIRERVERSLRLAGLWDEVHDRLDAPGIGLSGGQQQRLCIARAIAIEPRVLLMDEPCSALDPISTLKVEELIGELASRYVVVIVTHNLQQAARVAESTAFMLDGELVEHGPTERMFTNPADARTERYVTGQFG